MDPAVPMDAKNAPTRIVVMVEEKTEERLTYRNPDTPGMSLKMMPVELSPNLHA